MGLLLIERLLWPPLLKDWGPRLREAGRFFYLGILMIRRWEMWMNFSIPCILIYLTLSKESAWFGNCRRRGISTFAPFMTSFEVPCLLLFLGKVFRSLRPLCTSLSLFGLQLGRRFLQGTLCDVEALIWLTGVLCSLQWGVGESFASPLWKSL